MKNNTLFKNVYSGKVKEKVVNIDIFKEPCDLCGLDENDFITDPDEIEKHSRELIRAYEQDMEQLKKQNFLLA